ncbi:alpha/beta hydrolase [Ferrovibrio sp.]|uniref:RBBP9/YdeN family alpha/beta hydrolase n=1 Tax=Ferrovibrio sp. TaxID=1917215 RepID=UPI002603CE81|nr:alpha/beta hydrolase [Ferrovibrio sp.]
MRPLRPPVLIVPGLGNSGPEHWQSHWQQANPDFIRVEQADWDRPDLNDWLARLDAAITACPAPPVVVAHSLACALTAHWVTRHGGNLHGALLVAPADVDSDSHTPPETHGFRPMPLTRFACPAIVAASSNDPFVDFGRARHFARCWGARFVDAGACGHVNSTSGLGDWSFGYALLEDLFVAE